MARAIQMIQLTQRLRAAAAAQNWSALEAADQELAALLARAASSPVLTPAERTALPALEQAHRQALAQCANACEQLIQRMGELQANKDGWLAYALHSDLNDTPL